jgi:cell division protein FtsQ
VRRPSPLPAPPPRAEKAEDEPVEVALRLGAAPSVEAVDGEPAAVLPFEREVAPDEPDADPGVVADEGASADAGPLRARHVWAAARARRRALRAEVRRFTVRQRRRRMVWLGVGAALVLLVLGTVGAAYSPLFGVEKVRVVGTSQLPVAAVERALAGQIGRPLPLVDSSEVKAALVAFPLVESYTLEARPPHELVVRIVERTPIGTLKSAAGYTLVDAAGVALSTTPERPSGHPVLKVPGGVTSKAFTAIGTVFRSLPDDIRAEVTAISATTPNDVTLTLGKSDTDIVWGDASRSAYKAVVLERIMMSQPPSKVAVYDVSSPTAVVVR